MERHEVDMRLVLSVALCALVSVASRADEPVGIKGIYLGMSVAELEDLLSTDVYCELAPMDAFAYCATTTNPKEGRSAVFKYPMTIAGQDCELGMIRADNDGVSELDSSELFVYEVNWSCDSDSEVIERALRIKFGEPTSEDESDVTVLGTVSSVSSMTWEFRSEWEQLPQQPSESVTAFIARTQFPKELTLYTGEAPTSLNLRNSRVSLIANGRKERRELEDI